MSAWYPPEPVARRRTIVGDAIVGGLLVVFAVLALSVHDAVGDLGQMGREIRRAGEGLRDSGRSTAREVRGAFAAAADAGGVLPVLGDLAPLRRVGDRLASSLERQAVATGEDLAASGRQGERDAARVAALAGWVTFLVPSALLLAITLPPRLRQIRRLRGGRG